ncbi:MAG TPA: glycoside hydrolase family 2 TIM barrel-domain containing protein [Pyrinomonadaceae bacterium]|nr:glycoside hydrolase family 2 TIM barrel-domain containing protein [Pyrinomonadaceae bacterium]
MEQLPSRVPRPEYPRPQFERTEWLNLNGEWEFAFDDENKGRELGWHYGLTLERRIVVPFPYQSQLSGINDKSIHEVVWYARSFEVPPDWRRGQDLLLHFGAVDYSATVWVNGQEVGHNQGGHVPFDFDIAPYLKPDTNRLTVRVEDRQNPRQPRGKQSSTGLPHDIDYYCTTGIWQTVWLEPAPTIRIGEIVITPSARAGSIELSIFLHAPSAPWRLEAEAFDGEQLIVSASQTTTAANAQLTLRIPDAKLWSPDSPHLYDLRLRLYEGEQLLDEVRSYAGLRDVELREQRVWLNGQPVYLVMVLDQGYWPESYLAAPSDDALRADVELTKSFGFNGARKHQKIEDPRWLYWCDRLGLLVWEEMPNAREWSSQAEERLAAEWKRAVRRDYNHPCIITWVPVNESMGFPKLRRHHPGQYAFIERMVAMTRQLDPRRPVIDNDGWEHTDITDICAIHDYTPTAEMLRQRYQETNASGTLPAHVWIGNKPLFVLGSRYRGQPIMLTEVGGFLLIPPQLAPEERDMLYKFYGSFKTSEELLEKYRDLMEGIASLRFLAGFCYTQLTDIEQEINGLLTYDRRPKVAPEKIAAIHRRLFDAG